MSLSHQQKTDIIKTALMFGNELNNDVSAIDKLKVLNDEYDGQVTTFLAGIITPQEWMTVRSQIVTWRDTFWSRVAALRGDDLEALRLPEEEPELEDQ